MHYYVLFGLISAALAAFLYPFIYNNTDWNPYPVWIAALSAVTWVIYGLDKLLSKMGSLRVPERLLNLLAMLGGFPGGWLGMFIFHHKTNTREHPSVWITLMLSTLGHTVLTYYWFFRGD